jgi:hypothetical protein
MPFFDNRLESFEFVLIWSISFNHIGLINLEGIIEDEFLVVSTGGGLVVVGLDVSK